MRAGKTKLAVDLAVVGAGSGGLSVAAGAAQLGLSVALFERGEMGGDCLNVGCVPSKSLIAAAKRAHELSQAERLGVRSTGPGGADWSAVRRHVRGVIDAIAPIDSQARFESLGVKVIREEARFLDRRTLESESATVRAERIVIASGGRPAVPDIPGLADTPFLTNETIFDAPAFPHSLIILGGGPVGVELGQAFRRLGADVTIVESGEALKRFDRDARDLVLASLRAEGVTVLEHTRAIAAEPSGDGVRLRVETAGGARDLTGSHLLVAVGRRPNHDSLACERGGVATDSHGIRVKNNLRSVSNPRVWAVGDAAGRELATHAAGYHASVFVRSALFKARASADALIPAALYVDPEVVQVGLSETDARERFGDRQKTVTVPFEDNDRARAEGRSEGFLKVMAGAGGKILGAVAVGEGAGDVILPVAIAMANGHSLRPFTNVIAPYPTRGEIVKRLASLYYSPLLFSPPTRALISLLKRIP